MLEADFMKKWSIDANPKLHIFYLYNVFFRSDSGGVSGASSVR
jgi:hypothetical protein